MLTKRVSMLLFASVFCTAMPASITVSQAAELRCDRLYNHNDLRQRCMDDQRKKKLIDRTITNSVKSKTNASAKGVNSNNDNGGDDDGTNTGSADTDHDNGHGNDPGHTDPSNPGQGVGNHGTGNNGHGNNGNH